MITSAKAKMTSRQRGLATVENRPVDRLCFWPKLCGANARSAGKTIQEMHRIIGSDIHTIGGSCHKQLYSKCGYKVETDGDDKTEYFITPKGTLTRTMRWDDASDSAHPVNFPVEKKQDIEILTDYYNDIKIAIDEDMLSQTKSRFSQAVKNEDATIGSVIGESPLMYWIEYIAGIENAHYMLADFTDQVHELFAAIHRVLLDITKLAARNVDADTFYFIENTSSTLISPDQYRTYCQKHLSDYRAVLSEHNKSMALHMCGHLKALLPDINQVGADVFEAFTSPGVGNTTLKDGRDVCGETCLLGGTNAAIWLEPAQTIIDQLQKDLDKLPHHRRIYITSGGIMPPAADVEKIKKVAQWIHNYPART